MGKRTISIGGATYDLFVQTEEGSLPVKKNEHAFLLPIGAKIRVKNVVEACGGGASNTSVGLARLGCQASFCGVLGDDQWGEKLLENLKKEGVDVSCATVVERETSSFSLILSANSGDRTILYDPGTNAHLHDSNFNRELAKENDWVYLNHIQEDSCVIQDDISDILIGDASIRFTWNPGGCQIDAGMKESRNQALLKQTDLLLLNKEEALKFTKTDASEAALHTLLKAGAKTICITDGSRGTIATDGTKIYHCPVVSDVKVIDTTGAGDAFGTGMTWALVEGLDLPTALRAGTINAANVVRALGAQAGLLTDTKMKAELQRVTLDVTESPL